MEIRNLMTFIHVAELNSFTNAAKMLNYSQSTVSFQIMQLEKETGGLLFERINRTLTLTDRGRELLEYAMKVVRLTDEFEQQIQRTQEVRGNVHIVTSDSIAENMMYNNYIEFNQLYPQVSLKFTTAGTGSMFEMLDRNEADIVLTLDQHYYRSDYIIVREKKEETHFIAASSSPLAVMERVPIRQIMEYPLFLTEKGVGYRSVMDDALAKQYLELQPALEISRTDIITRLVEQGAGISFLPDFVTEPMVRAGSIVRLNVPEVKVDIWKQMLHHKNKWVSHALEAFISYASDHEFREE